MPLERLGQGLARACAHPAALLAALCLLFSTGCAASTPTPSVPGERQYDRPIPADQARKNAGYRVDLEPVADCEQTFDLELYRDRRIELIAWDDADGCHNRAIDVRYLSAQLAEPQLFNMIRKLVRAAERRPKR